MLFTLKASIPLICSSIQRIGEPDFVLSFSFWMTGEDISSGCVASYLGCLLDDRYNSSLTGKSPLEKVEECVMKRVSYDSSGLVKLLEVR